MPKYVTLEWYEYTSLKEALEKLSRRATEFSQLRDGLIPLVEKPEDMKYYSLLGPIPPEEWRPVSNEEIIKRIKEKVSDK